MSTLRNIAAHLWHGGLVRKANVVLGGTAAVLAAACAAENTVAPAPASAAQRGRADLSATDAQFDANGDGKLSPAEKAVADSVKKAMNAQSKARLDSLKADWEAYKRALREGTVTADFLRCEPKPAVTVTKVLGPKGGSFNVGPHKFEVPAGALDSNVTITATAPTSARAELEFYPHGLQFNRPVQMTINYKGCVVPSDAVLGISYIDHPFSSAVALRDMIKQRMPSTDDKAGTTVSALTDHFSGYVIAYGRTVVSY